MNGCYPKLITSDVATIAEEAPQIGATGAGDTSGYLKAMLQASDNGAIIMPPAFYARLTSLDNSVNHTVGSTLDLFELDNNLERGPALTAAMHRGLSFNYRVVSDSMCEFWPSPEVYSCSSVATRSIVNHSATMAGLSWPSTSSVTSWVSKK